MRILTKAGSLLLAFCLLVPPVSADELIPQETIPEVEESTVPAYPSEPFIETATISMEAVDVVPAEERTVPASEATSSKASGETATSTDPAQTATTEAGEETATSTEATGDYVPGEVLVKFKESRIDLERSSGEAKAEAFADAEGLEVEESLGSANIVVMNTDEDPVAEAERLSDNPNVEFAEPNYLYELTDVDPLRSYLWALENTGSAFEGVTGTADADIDGTEAWTFTLGEGVIVAVVDTGVDYTHPDLAASMWDGSDCVLNGTPVLGGCLHGYDFYRDDNDPMPDHYHGTHVAGTIAAAHGNGTGIAGIAPEAKIMALRTDFTLGGSLFLETDAIVAAIDFARENGAEVINASFRGPSYSTPMYEAIERFGTAGGIFVAASGNDTNNNDATPYYPTGYDLENIVSVAATSQTDNRASFSNYGATSVDLGAPGVNIVSTMPESGTICSLAAVGKYDCLSGTSMAAPHVAGTAALLKSFDPTLSVAEVKTALLSTGDSLSGLAGRTVSGKRLNAFSALSSVASGLATSTLTVEVSVVNDNGRTATTTDFTYSINGGTTIASERDGSAAHKVVPGFYTVEGTPKVGYTLATTSCADIVLYPNADLTCTLTYDDVLDTTAPVITLTGPDPQSLRVGTSYTEQGATALDAIDGDLTSAIVIDATTVNTSTVGTYTVTYSVTDTSGNAATSTRAVNVSSPPSSSGGGGGGGSSRRGGSSSKKKTTTKTTKTIKKAPTKKTLLTKKTASAKAAAPAPKTVTPPLSYSGYRFTRDLALGSQGLDVIELQKFLVSKGFLATAPTGYFGPVTQDALRRYQAANGIMPATGYMGPLTRAKLNTK